MAVTNEFRPARLLSVVEELDRIIGLNKGIDMVHVNQLFMGTKAYSNLNKFEKKNVYNMAEVKEVLKRVMERSMDSTAKEYTFINMNKTKGDDDMDIIKTTNDNQVPENIQDYFKTGNNDAADDTSLEDRTEIVNETEIEDHHDTIINDEGGSITGGVGIDNLKVNVTDVDYEEVVTKVEPEDRVYMFKDKKVYDVNEHVEVQAEAASSRKIKPEDVKSTDEKQEASENDSKEKSSELSQAYIDEVEKLVTSNKEQFTKFMKLAAKHGKNFKPDHMMDDLALMGAVAVLSMINHKYGYTDEKAYTVMARLLNVQPEAKSAEPVSKPETNETCKEIVPTGKVRTFEVIRPTAKEDKKDEVVLQPKRSSIFQAYDRERTRRAM